MLQETLPANFKFAGKEQRFNKRKDESHETKVVKNPTQTNGSLFQGNNNIVEENPMNQIQNQTQTYQAENLSLTNFPQNIFSGFQLL